MSREDEPFSDGSGGDNCTLDLMDSDNDSDEVLSVNVVDCSRDTSNSNDDDDKVKIRRKNVAPLILHRRRVIDDSSSDEENQEEGEYDSVCEENDEAEDEAVKDEDENEKANETEMANTEKVDITSDQDTIRDESTESDISVVQGASIVASPTSHVGSDHSANVEVFIAESPAGDETSNLVRNFAGLVFSPTSISKVCNKQTGTKLSPSSNIENAQFVSTRKKYTRRRKILDKANSSADSGDDIKDEKYDSDLDFNMKSLYIDDKASPVSQMSDAEEFPAFVPANKVTRLPHSLLDGSVDKQLLPARQAENNEGLRVGVGDSLASESHFKDNEDAIAQALADSSVDNSTSCGSNSDETVSIFTMGEDESDWSDDSVNQHIRRAPINTRKEVLIDSPSVEGPTSASYVSSASSYDRLSLSDVSGNSSLNSGIDAATLASPKKEKEGLATQTDFFEDEVPGSVWKLDHATDEYFLDGDGNRQWPGLRIQSGLYHRLYSHQKVGVQWIASMHQSGTGGILGDDMGMGKTFQTLTCLGGLMKAGTIRNALIVGPVSIMRIWEREAIDILKGSCVPRVTISVVSSDINKARRARLVFEALSCSSKHPHLVITTYGLVASSPVDFVQQNNLHHNKQWDYVVLDEGHKIKNPSTKASKGCQRICSSEDTRRLLLTGTPIQNNLRELWALFDWATSGRLLGNNKKFLNEFAIPIEDGRHKNASEWTMKTAEKANRRLQDVLRPHFLQRTKNCEFKEHLPNKRELVVWTHLSELQRNMYESYVVDGGRVSAVLSGELTSPLEAIAWLKKLCGHPCLVAHDIKTNDVSELIANSSKLEVLCDLVRRLKKTGHRTLIFSQSTKMLDIIESVLDDIQLGRIDGSTKEKFRQAAVDNFNKKESTIDAMLLSTKACSLGLTLTGADRAVIYDPSWNPAEDSQAVDRCYRIGQRNDVTVYRLVSAGTVEERMYEKQVFKDGLRRTLLTNGGSATERYFDKNELKRMFQLAPVGVCEMLNKFQSDKPAQAQGGEGLVGSSGKRSFLEVHCKVVGISSHDMVYQNTMVDLADSKDFSGNQAPFARTPAYKNIDVHSVPSSIGRRIDFEHTTDKAENQVEDAKANNHTQSSISLRESIRTPLQSLSNIRANTVPLGRHLRPGSSKLIEDDLRDENQCLVDARPISELEEKERLSQTIDQSETSTSRSVAFQQSINDNARMEDLFAKVQHMTMKNKIKDSLGLLLSGLELARGPTKLRLHKEIAVRAHHLGWI